MNIQPHSITLENENLTINQPYQDHETALQQKGLYMKYVQYLTLKESLEKLKLHAKAKKNKSFQTPESIAKDAKQVRNRGTKTLFSIGYRTR